MGSSPSRATIAAKPSIELPREEYTVGWIAAIPTESAAACEYFDEQFLPPKSLPKDDNVYSLGRMGKHNVVIATLPDGEYGTDSAARVAGDLARTFINIRFGLMVGIGGGVPSEQHDIRLGDVVVSSPSNGIGGVFQYDYGKSVRNGQFVQTRVLDQPPKVLRAAVAAIRAWHKGEDPDLERSVDKILHAKPRLRREFGRPQNAPDHFYESTFPHVDATRPCTEICASKSSRQVSRSVRKQDEDDPAIHYGIIASGNQVMEDASLRDKIAAERNILCFEMEAAGLMNHFPCLVIRGICDYADSHKNKPWQGFAAMTAAAYAKQLLSHIQPTAVQSESKISEILERCRFTSNDRPRN